MIRRLTVATLALAACGKSADKPPPAPVGSAQPIPEASTIDWKNLHYDLGSLGTVKATGGRAEFHVVEDDDSTLHATQAPGASAAWAGFLDVDDPAYVDLDGDGHDEAAIPFELKSAQVEETPHVFGVFVFTLRDGKLLKIGTITTSSKPGFTIEGSTIKTADGKRWTWDTANHALVERR
jgi:hypothetical protein